MNKILGIILFFSVYLNSYGQDGSNILYYKGKSIDSKLIGKYAHIDFYRKSFGGKIIDTVIINIDNKPIKFIEKRNDNGYDNWFFQQYLQSIDSFDGNVIRIIKCKIEEVTKDSVLVTNYIEFYDNKNDVIAQKSKQMPCWFKKENIAEVLVLSKQ